MDPAGVSFRRALLGSGALCAAALVLMPMIGSSALDWRAALSGVSPDAEILWLARVPRVLLAALAGGGLAVVGVLFQGLLRDSLADPYTMGISSGSSLGAVLAISFGWQQAAGVPAVWIAALAGASLSLLLVMALASSGRRVSSFSLLMSGVTLNAICVAMILLLQSVASLGQSFAIVRWLMGGIETVEYGTLAVLAAIVIPVVAILAVRGRDWNLMAAGEEWAASKGVDTARLMWIGFWAGSLITASITAITGPIGFLGLLVPHALRLRLGADHRVLIVASFFTGGAFLAVCDTVARTAFAPADLPVGVITAMLGGPFFLWLLRTRQKRYWL